MASSPLAARLLVRRQILAQRRTSNAATQAAIDKALLDPNYIDDTTASCLIESGATDTTDKTGSFLQTLLQWLESGGAQNLFQIIMEILALFGGGAVVKEEQKTGSTASPAAA